MATKFTAKSVEAMKPDPTKRLEIADPAADGLFLVIQPTGRKSWAARYRFEGKSRKLTLGPYPAISLAEARAGAADARRRVALGQDPAAQKQDAKAAELEAKLAERDKVGNLLDVFAKRHLSKLRSGKTVKRQMDVHIRPLWGDLTVHEITKRDVIDLIDWIADSGRVTTANRVRGYISKFFNWCIERAIMDASPATGVKAVAAENSRDRVLSDEEIRWVWRAASEEQQPWQHIVKLLILTGQRKGEVAGLSDREIEGDVWRLPKERVKNKRAHDVPLSPAALDVVASIKRVKSANSLYFTTTGKTPVSGFGKFMERLRKRVNQIATEERGEPVRIEPWTLHDLRRTTATGMARMGIPVRVTESVLNHVSGTGGGIVGVYQRHDYADEKRQALDAWGRRVLDIVEGREGNVVPILGGSRDGQ